MEENMRKRIIVGSLVLIGALTLVFSMGGCDLFGYWGSPQGYVIDGTSGEGVKNVTVKLIPREMVPPDELSDTEKDDFENADDERQEFSTTTDSDGYYTFTDYEEGSYILTAEKDDYGFTQHIVEVSGLAQYMPNIAAIGEDDENIRLVMMWNQQYADVDMHITYPKPTSDPTLGATFSNDTDKNHYVIDNSTDAYDGFYPEDNTDRERLYWDNKDSTDEYDGGPTVFLDVDNRGKGDDLPGGPETVTIRYIPFVPDSLTNNGFSVNSSDHWTKLPKDDSNQYFWGGVMELYADSFNESGGGSSDDSTLVTSDGKTGADVVVHVLQGTDYLGTYSLPQFTEVDRASLVRINCFFLDDADWTNVFQILPDTRITPVFRTSAMDEDGIITVVGKGRR
jgi:hypothetical protein